VIAAVAFWKTRSRSTASGIGRSGTFSPRIQLLARVRVRARVPGLGLGLRLGPGPGLGLGLTHT
jgi:hypothetical protein